MNDVKDFLAKLFISLMGFSAFGFAIAAAVGIWPELGLVKWVVFVFGIGIAFFCFLAGTD